MSRRGGVRTVWSNRLSEERQLVVDAMDHHVEEAGPAFGVPSPRQRALYVLANGVLFGEPIRSTVRFLLRSDPAAFRTLDEQDLKRFVWAHLLVDIGGPPLRRWLAEQALVRARDGGYDVRLAATAVCLTWREAA